MTAAVVRALTADFALAVLLDVAGLARSTYYYHDRQHRLEAARPQPHAALDATIRTVFAGAKGRYGHRRVQQAVRAQGHRVTRHTVRRRMQVLGLVCRVRRRRPFLPARDAAGASHRTVPNALDRQFDAAAPNQKWVTDLTELRVGGQKRYLAPVMDLYDRQIIAYRLGSSPNLALVTATLRTALATLGPGERPLVHSDQGFQYQHRAWHQLIQAAGATASMSRKGTCLDNAVIESFFGQLKAEVFVERFATIAALETAVHAYIHWYNTARISTRLQGMSPVQFRATTQPHGAVHARAPSCFRSKSKISGTVQFSPGFQPRERRSSERPDAPMGPPT